MKNDPKDPKSNPEGYIYFDYSKAELRLLMAALSPQEIRLSGGTCTGRMSSYQPEFQRIPRSSRGQGHGS